MNVYKETLKKTIGSFRSGEFREKFLSDCGRMNQEERFDVDVLLNGLRLKVRFMKGSATALLVEDHGIWYKTVFKKEFPFRESVHDRILQWASERLLLILKDSCGMERLGYEQTHFTRFEKESKWGKTVVDRRGDKYDRDKDFDHVEIYEYGNSPLINEEEAVPWDDGMKDITEIVIPVEKRHMTLEEYISLPQEMRDVFA